jgi:hypothetical protein
MLIKVKVVYYFLWWILTQVRTWPTNKNFLQFEWIAQKTRIVYFMLHNYKINHPVLHTITVKPELTTTSEWRPLVYKVPFRIFIQITSEHQSRVNNDHYCWVPRSKRGIASTGIMPTREVGITPTGGNNVDTF